MSLRSTKDQFPTHLALGSYMEALPRIRVRLLAFGTFNGGPGVGSRGTAAEMAEEDEEGRFCRASSSKVLKVVSSS